METRVAARIRGGLLLVALAGLVPAHLGASPSLAAPAPAGAGRVVEASDSGAKPAGLDAKFGVGAWIWAAATTDKQTCRFWRRVTIPAGVAVVEARMRITADNAYTLWLDGQEVGRGTEWRSLTEYNLTWRLSPGEHVLAVEVFNDYLDGGLLAGLRVDFADGTVLEVPTDERWWLVPEEQSGWRARRAPREQWLPARVVAPFLGGTWKVKPSRIVREQPLRPVELHFWQTTWFQVTLLLIGAGAAAFYLRLLGRLAGQAQTQEMLKKERARIARDIHDDFGARLTKLVLFGEVAQRELAGQPEVCARFERICAEGRSLLSAVDEVIWTVNSHRDTLHDFETHVCNQAEAFLRPTALRLRLETDPDLPEAAMDLGIRRNLFLAVKEALNNVVRHAQAQELRLGLQVREGQVEVTIEDDGRGFEAAAVGTVASERNGLANMRQRMAELGGVCRVTSRPGAGCRVELRAPLRYSTPRGQGWWRRWLPGGSGGSKPGEEKACHRQPAS